MTITKIDEAIERYVAARQMGNRDVAASRFISYAYLACGEGDMAAFMKRTRGLICYYIDYLTVLENPFRGPQAGWLFLAVLIFSFGIFMLTDDGLRLAGIVITSGALVNGITLIRSVVDKWVNTGVRIAIYRELIELIDANEN